MATLGMSEAEREAVERLQRDVIEPSMSNLVLLDFWTEWCGPCKQLGPLLDKLAADYADKGVKLVKIDVEGFEGHVIRGMEKTIREHRPAVVMEFVPGETLESIIARDGTLDLTQALDYTCQICNAVDHAHRHGVLHRICGRRT